MRQTVAVAQEIAKTERAQKCTPKRTHVRQILPFESFLREIWPEDRTKNYMRLTGAKVRTAKYRVAGKRPPDYAEIVAILRSEHGFRFLKHALGDARPQWFSGVERAKNIGDMRRRLAQQQRELAQLEMEID